MTKKDNKKVNKDKDLVKEVNNENNIWKSLESKTWMVLEFGVYVLLFGFTVFAVGYYVPTALNNRIATKNLEGNYDSIYYNLDYYCDNIFDCTVELDEDKEISYISNSDSISIEIGDTTINLEEPIDEFAILANDYVATFETVDNDHSIITYYNSKGVQIESFNTILKSMGKLDRMNGYYATCNGNVVETHEYEMNTIGDFTDTVVGTYESSMCE